MFATTEIQAENKQDYYVDLQGQLAALVSGERDWLANFANAASLIFYALPDLNWAGFYLLKGGELVLGPFQGRVACIRIAVGRGVCGTALARGCSMVVPDVHEFPGHIACDSASRAELVVPLRMAGEIVGVLDLDSPQAGRFDDDDRRGCERLMETLLAASDFPE